MEIEDICPVNEALNFFNRKWIFCILTDMFRGLKHFTDFQESNPQLSNNTLSQTLKYMEDVDLIEKIIINEKTRNKTEYILTEKGLKTNKILFELSNFAINELNINIPDNEFKEKLEHYYKKNIKLQIKKFLFKK